MALLLVDDSPDDLLLIRSFLRSAGYEVLTVTSMNGALDLLMNMPDPLRKIDLILLDVLMPEDDGFRTCRRIKAIEEMKEIPIIMVSSQAEPSDVRLAFTQGAIDYIRKPIIKVELLTRVRVVLKLREEMSLRQTQTRLVCDLTEQLAVATEELQTVSRFDSLTGLVNWERFDELFNEEWVRAAKEDIPLSLIFFSLADFKTFNDTYGYVSGDECLQRLAEASKQSLTGPNQIIARYRGAEFIMLLPEVNAEEATSIGDALRKNVDSLELGLSLHVGVATAHPNQATSRVTLLALVKEALLRAKQAL